MKLPWVSRESAERLIAYHEQNAREWKGLLYDEMARVAALHETVATLQQRLASLKMAGATEPPKDREWDGLTAPAPRHDEMRDLIHEKYGHDSRRLRLALAQLTRDRADRVDDDKIRDGILNGYSPEGVPA